MTAQGFEISSDSKRIDIDMVCEFLATSYWATGWSREVIARSIQNSICFGAYYELQQVAFARLVTDRAVFAYLADVFVLPPYRGRGVAKALIAAVLDHSELQGLRVFLLRTRDAHGLYRQFGFRALQRPEDMMGRYSGER